MKENRKEKGISLISLIITIVVVLIIASIAINSIYRQNVIDKANEAVSESNRVAGIEQLRIEEVNYFLANNGKVATVESFVDYLDERGIISKEETEFEGENKASVILENKAVYELEMTPGGNLDVTYVGQAGNLAPLLKISVTGATTNEVTVTPTLIRRNEGGKLKYYIKLQEESEYTFKGETSNTSYTYTGLTKDKVYDIKVIAENTQNMQTEVTTSAVTTDIILPEVTFTYDPVGWTNGNVTVTAVATNEASGMTLYIGESLSTCNALASIGITVTENKPVYAVFKDSSNQYGGAATGNVENIDKIAPVITSIDVTTNSLTINATDSGGSNLAKYAISTTNAIPNAGSFQASNVFSVNHNTEYYAWAMDGAGNISASSTNTTTEIQTPTVTFTYSPNNWTNGNVTVTAVATNEVAGMTLYIGESLSTCNTLASEGITVTENKQVYAVYKDSSDQYGGAATGNVEKIDKVEPSITTTESSGAYNITIKGQDLLSGINAYYYSTSNTTPTLDTETSSIQESDKWVTFTASTSEISKTLTGFTEAGTYYYWFKDQAGNISEGGTFTTTSVPASSIQYVPQTSGWNSGDVQDAIDKLYEMYE